MGTPTTAGPLALLLLGVLLATAGCVQETGQGPPEDDAGPDEAPPVPGADCDHATVPGEQDGRDGHVLVMSCDGQGPGSQQASLACPDPAGTELQAGTDLAAGQITVTVQDGAGTTIAEATLPDTGGDRRTVPIDRDQAEPGDWTATVERSDAYDGEHRVELWCPGS